MDNELNEQQLQHLKWALQALAQPGQVQVHLFPPNVSKGDELGLDFGHWWECVQRDTNSLTVDQQERLMEVNTFLSSLSELQDTNLSTDEAILSSSFWEHARRLARKALESLNWDNIEPPSDRSLYS